MANEKQPQPAPEPPKQVAPRNNFKSSALYRNSRATELQNRDPSFVYKYFTTKEDDPQYVGRVLSEHEYGTQVGGFVTVKGWEPVHRLNDPKVQQLDPRTDQGKPVDTLHRKGRQILCRLSKDEYAKYEAADEAYQMAMDRQIHSPERSGDGVASMTAVVSREDGADHLAMLKQAGHNIPGY